MRYFRRGRHRANRFSQPVRELVADCRRVSIEDIFARLDAQWSRRGHEITITVGDGR